jgi:hypothetical protein
MKRVIFIVCLTGLFVSCKNPNRVQTEIMNCSDSSIDSIFVLYYNSLFQPFMGVKSEEINTIYIPDFENKEDGILDATIKDCKILTEIEHEILKLKPSKEASFEDVRIKATIYYKNGATKLICLNNWLSTSIFLDGFMQESNNRLLYLIKNNIGYYSWFGEPILKYMDELQDTTFVREPFIESPYYKKFKEIQEKNTGN